MSKIINIIRGWLRQEASDYKQWFKSLLLNRSRKRAIKIADARLRATGKHQYVLTDKKGNFNVLNSKEIKELKRSKLMNRSVNVLNLIEEAVYTTLGSMFIVLWDDEGVGTWEFFKGTIDQVTAYVKDEIKGHQRHSTVKVVSRDGKRIYDIGPKFKVNIFN